MTCDNLEQSRIKSTFTWDPKWIQTGLKSQTTLKCCSVYIAISLLAALKSQTAFKICPIYKEISLQQLPKQ